MSSSVGDVTIDLMPLDMSRPVATSADDHSLTIEEAVIRYEHAGHPRTARSIQRFCAKGHLDCLRQETQFGEKFMITPASVARHIAQIAELAQTTGLDMSRHGATNETPNFASDNARHVATGGDKGASVAADDVAKNLTQSPNANASTSPDESRHVATRPDIADKYVARLEGEIEFLRAEIGTKNLQIAELTERSHETNTLIAGLQRMLSPLLGSPDPYRQTQDHDAA